MNRNSSAKETGMKTQKILEDLEKNFTQDDEKRIRIEDMKAASLLACTMNRSILTALAAAAVHAVGEITVTLPKYEPATAEAMTTAFLGLAGAMQESVDAGRTEYDEESAMRRLGIRRAVRRGGNDQ